MNQLLEFTMGETRAADKTDDLMSGRDKLKEQLAEKDARIKEQAAQIVALRMFAGKVRLADWEYLKSSNLHTDATVALSTPAPVVVPLEDVMPLIPLLKELAVHDAGTEEILAEFLAKHPPP